MEMRPQLKVSSDSIVKSGIKLVTPGLQGKQFNQVLHQGYSYIKPYAVGMVTPGLPRMDVWQLNVGPQEHSAILLA